MLTSLRRFVSCFLLFVLAEEIRPPPRRSLQIPMPSFKFSRLKNFVLRAFDCSLASQAAEGTPIDSAPATPGSVQQDEARETEEGGGREEEESYDYGCAPPSPPQTVRVPPGEDGKAPQAAEEADTPAAAAAVAAAAAAAAQDRENPSQEGTGEAAGATKAGVVSATADLPADEAGGEAAGSGGGAGAAAGTAAAAAAPGEEKQEGGPTDEELLEAVRGMPSSVEDIGQLTPKQVRC